MKLAEKVRLADLAKNSGESIATVSRVINGLPHVSEEKRKRVFTAIKELGYRPSDNKKKRVAIIVEGIDSIVFNGYQSMLLAAFTRHLSREIFSFEIISSGAVNEWNEALVQGALVLVYTPDSLEAISRLKIPLLLINTRHKDHPSVCSDHRDSIHLAVEKLVRLGHKRIAHVHTGSRSWGNLERIAAYEEALEKWKLKLDPKLCVAWNGSDDEQKILTLAKLSPTAIIVSSEDNGIRLYGALHRAGKKIPDDISVVSFEFPSVSRYLVPAATTISQNVDAIADLAVKRLKKILEGETDHQGVMLLPDAWIERESTKNLNA
jgi:DNA-binding LacI/PurR family transcriptional regulator